MQDLAKKHIPAGAAITNWIEKDAVFNISGAVRRVNSPAEERRNKQRASRQLANSRNYAIKTFPVKDTQPPPLLKGAKTARKQDTQRYIRSNKTYTKPTKPKSGQYTVILGKYSKEIASRHMNNLKRKRIDAILLPVRSSTDKIISLGSYEKKVDANIVANMLNEKMKIKSTITKTPYQFESTGIRRRTPTYNKKTTPQNKLIK